MNKKLYRDEYHKMIGGVCSGLAEYFDMDVTVVRLLFAFTIFVMGVGLIPYIILWIVLPKKGYLYNSYYNNPTVDYTVPPQQSADQASNPYNQNPFGGNPFGGNPYGGNPYGDNPFESVPKKQKSHAGIIVGVVLIIIGASILIDEFDLIPDFDFDRLWPLVLVVVGAALIVSGQQRQNWLHHTEKKGNPVVDEDIKADSTNTPPTTTEEL